MGDISGNDKAHEVLDCLDGRAIEFFYNQFTKHGNITGDSLDFQVI